MTLIVPGRVVRVTIRKLNKRGDRVIAFSFSLMQKMFDGVTHVAVSIDAKTRTLTFYPSGKKFQNQPAHKLVQEGGSRKVARCVKFSAAAAKAIKNVPSMRYEVEIFKDRFEIRWGKP